MGFDVDCGCYSEYLSQRDFLAFESSFNGFGLREYVRYGTFNKLFEDFINRKGDIRNLVTSAINARPGELVTILITAKERKYC